MALITSAPETITGVCTSIFTSPPLAENEEVRVNIIITFGLPTVKAIYSNEEAQIAGLSTIKPYGVYFGPYVDSTLDSVVFKCSFMDATYTATEFTGVGNEITFTKDEEGGGTD